jgi:hypothetical protein
MKNNNSNKSVSGTDINEVRRQNQQSQQKSQQGAAGQNISGTQQSRSKNQSLGNK